jgi:nucleoside-diphosphate-sugar epimerase
VSGYGDPLRVLVTGAAGFVGLRLVELLRPSCQVLALDRRVPLGERGQEPNVAWYQIDLGDAEATTRLLRELGAGGRIDAVFHLAAYYDFTGEDHPEYFRTNVDGTRHLLAACQEAEIGRFFFASSVAACDFPRPGRALDESSPADGDHLYAATKRLGETMVREANRHFPTAIFRFAALFSDWSQYAPLTAFLTTWLTPGWNARILGGRGRSAVPYLHVRDLMVFLQQALVRRHQLEPGEILIASPDGATSHRELFEAATAYGLGRVVRPLYAPALLAGPGIRMRQALGHLLGFEPFERPWMAKYIDRELRVDARASRARLGWTPRPRLAIRHRIPFLIENWRSDPAQWHRLNAEHELALQLHPNLRIAGLLERHATAIAARIDQRLAEEAAVIPHYQDLPAADQSWNHRVVLRNLIHAVRRRDRAVFRAYCFELGERRASQGFGLGEVRRALGVVREVCLETLLADTAACPPATSLHEHVSVPFDFGIDAVEEAYELYAPSAHQAAV